MWTREGSRNRPTVSLDFSSYGFRVQRVQLLVRNEAFLWMPVCLAGPVDLRRVAQVSLGVTGCFGGLSGGREP